MSLLNPVLLPPKVKAYLSQGERFIKWDDVSRAGLPPGDWTAGRAAWELCRTGGLVFPAPRRLHGLTRQLSQQSR